jgi:hypothetical protein
MKLLYHASANPNLSVLKPQRTLSKDKYVGDFVFATPDKLLSVMYLTPKGYGSIMDTESDAPNILICGNEAEVRSKDRGGAIYSVDASKFHETPQKELTAHELVSDKPVTPISKEVYKSSFDALEKLGVRIEFIDQATFDRLAWA